MPDNKEQLLIDLAKARDDYIPYVEAVDADLAIERAKRLMKRQAEIRDLVVRAYVAGARIADLKRAYKTKDYGTIKGILESAGVERQVVEVQAVEVKPWYELNPPAHVTIVEGDAEAEFEIQILDDGVVLLVSNDDLYPNGFDSPANPVVAQWDGTLHDSTSTGQGLELYKAITEVS